MELFDTIEIKNEDIEGFQKIKNTIDIFTTAFNVSSRSLKDAYTMLWDAVYEKYPELNGYELNFDHTNNKLTVIGKKKTSTFAF